MQRIGTLLQRLTELSEKQQEHTLIDIDLMLDYTRVVYADLLEIRKNIAIHQITDPQPAIPQHEITIPDNIPQDIPVASTSENVPEPAESAPIINSVSVEEKYADVPVIDVRTHIGINDKYLYLSELFENDKAAYDKAIQHLNTFTSLAKATAWVDDELRDTYDWDEEHPTVQSFYGLLRSCFR